MKLTFLGTRGYIKESSRRHRRHSALMVSYRGRAVMIDCGEDWRGRIEARAPRAIVLTHGHPDHAFGLEDGSPCPVHATAETWALIDRYPIADRHEIHPRRPVLIEGIRFEAFPVAHSVRAPAVGYRVSAGQVSVFYVPDVVYIEDREAALRGVQLYIGDAATVTESFVRRRNDTLIGHAPLRTQITWCQHAGIKQAIFTHCGREIVAGDEREIGARVAQFGRERGVQASIAHDGMEVVLR